MNKLKSGTFFPIMVVSMSVGIIASVVVILVDEIAVLPFLMEMILGAMITAFVAGLAFLPGFLKLRAINRALHGINNGKQVELLEPLPFGILHDVISETNQLVESQIDFQSVRGRLYQQISEVAAQEERNRLARDLHDSIKQQVFSMSVSAAAAHAHLESNPLAAREALVDVKQSAQEAMVEMRVLLQQLAPAPLEQSGLIESMRQQMEALSYRTGARIETEFDKLPPNECLPIGAQETLFRIAQEALSNIARHARAKNVSLKLKHNPDHALILTIVDDGQGFDMSQVKRGMGLKNIEHRLEECGGEFVCDSCIGEGTRLFVTIPLVREEDTVNIKAERAKHKKLAEAVYHQYIGFACSMAGIIFSVTVGVRALIKDTSILLPIILALIGILTAIAAIVFWQNYRKKSRELHETVPKDSCAYKLVQQHRHECHWIIWFATAFVIPGSFVGIDGYLWLPNLIGLIILIAIIREMGGILINQHSYMKMLLPSELEETMSTFRVTVTSGIVVTVLVTVLQSDIDFSLLTETSRQWDGNFYLGIILMLVVYHLFLGGIYWHWRRISSQQVKETA